MAPVKAAGRTCRCPCLGYNHSTPLVSRCPPSRALALLLLLAGSALAQTLQPDPKPAPTRHRPRIPAAPYNPGIIVLDPAHGGDDNGARLRNNTLEKDVTVAFAARLRDTLAARGFTVFLTHADAADPITADQRTEAANRAHAAACLILHATGTGVGLHLYTSALTPTPPPEDSTAPAAIVPWDTAQASSLPRSLELANVLATSLHGLQLPLLLSAVSVRPIDSMACPAVALEIAPERTNAAVDDKLYNERIANSLTDALVAWRDQETQRIAQLQAEAAKAEAEKAPPAPARPRAPRLTLPAAPKPAPIIRRPPPPAAPQ